MSANFQNRRRCVPSLTFALIAFGLTVAPWIARPASAGSLENARRASWDLAVPLAAGETWRDAGGEAGESRRFTVEAPSAGLLVVEATLPADAPRVGLGPQGPGCEVLRRTATTLVLAAPAGGCRVSVASEDPRQPLPPFRLITRFAAESAALGTVAGRSETDSELEVDPIPFLAPPPADLHDLTELPAAVARHLGELCRSEETDDPGDGFLCAAEIDLGAVADGEIANPWGDDSDVFRFRVEELGPVTIEAAGEGPLAGAVTAELYDRHGQRLAVTTPGAGGPRLVRTLVPGTYFVRLTGRDGAAGSYAVSVAPPLL